MSVDEGLALVDVHVVLAGRRVLAGVHAGVAPGAVVGVTGASGSGKSVLCMVASGVLVPTAGHARFNGQAVSERRSRVGFILQNHGLVSGLSARETVGLPLQLAAYPREEIAARVVGALGDVGLAEHAEREVDELSGGERQRVGIARALALTPLLLVADEPTAELDPDNRTRVIQLLVRAAERGASVLVTSDDPDVLASCDATFLLDAGCVVRAPDPA